MVDMDTVNKGVENARELCANWVEALETLRDTGPEAPQEAKDAALIGLRDACIPLCIAVSGQVRLFVR